MGAPGLVWQNQADAGGFVANSGVIWRDGALSLGGIARPNGGAGGLIVASAAASTTPTTGALTVAGGVGVSGQLHVGNYIYSEVSDTGALFLGNSGAHYLAYDGTNFTLNGGRLNITNTTASTTYNTGALTVAGGVGVGGVINTSGGLTFGNGAAVGMFGDGANIGIRTPTGGAIYFQNTGGAATFGDWNATRLNIWTATASTSPTTGALTVAGGIGAAGAVTSINSVRVSAYISSAGSMGYNYGISSISDVAVGATDVTFITAFPGVSSFAATSDVYGGSANTTSNMLVLSAGACRIHSITCTTGALVDPFNYFLNVVGN